MPELNQSIFRRNAIKHYMEGREKHEIPRFISLPITILLWALLALFVAATLVVWSEQVPIYETTQGIVTAQSAASAFWEASIYKWEVNIRNGEIGINDRKSSTSYDHSCLFLSSGAGTQSAYGIAH